MPVAARPSWQFAQVLVSPPRAVWANCRTGRNAVDEWHAPQFRSVVRCDADLPLARMPLWQLIQEPGSTDV